MNGSWILTEWHWQPAALAGCGALILLYFWTCGWRWSSRAVSWAAGVLLLLLALVSPLGILADGYLFSAHMLRHMLLVLVIPALLLGGLPERPIRALLRTRWTASLERFLRRPPVAWTAGIGSMMFWHIPAVFNAALASMPLHIAEHLSLLIGGTIYWWPLLSPLRESRLRPVPEAAAYLFTSCLACTTLGVLITFAPAPLYSAYANPADPAGILRLVRGPWGISAAMDQQIGGLLMWVPGCLIYLTGILTMFGRWYGEQSDFEPAAR